MAAWLLYRLPGAPCDPRHRVPRLLILPGQVQAMGGAPTVDLRFLPRTGRGSRRDSDPETASWGDRDVVRRRVGHVRVRAPGRPSPCSGRNASDLLVLARRACRQLRSDRAHPGRLAVPPAVERRKVVMQRAGNWSDTPPLSCGPAASDRSRGPWQDRLYARRCGRCGTGEYRGGSTNGAGSAARCHRPRGVCQAAFCRRTRGPARGSGRLGADFGTRRRGGSADGTVRPAPCCRRG